MENGEHTTGQSPKAVSGNMPPKNLGYRARLAKRVEA